ncbi:MAG: hypothetical protein IMX04_05270 [Candidatus Carbobacillus altaicus]|nr:hypothetical protein [Candidatus Carbobacillus altaicus]
MRIGYWLKHWILSREETRDAAVDPVLRTRYYRERPEHVIQLLQEQIGMVLPGWRVTYVDAKRGELMVEKKGLLGTYDMMLTVYRLSPMRAAVDVVVSRRGPIGDFGYGYRVIERLYAGLGKTLKELEERHTKIFP